jgi:hypothetical protein
LKNQESIDHRSSNPCFTHSPTLGAESVTAAMKWRTVAHGHPRPIPSIPPEPLLTALQIVTLPPARRPDTHPTDPTPPGATILRARCAARAVCVCVYTDVEMAASGAFRAYAVVSILRGLRKTTHRPSSVPLLDDTAAKNAQSIVEFLRQDRRVVPFEPGPHHKVREFFSQCRAA